MILKMILGRFWNMPKENERKIWKEGGGREGVDGGLRRELVYQIDPQPSPNPPLFGTVNPRDIRNRESSWYLGIMER